MPNNDNDEFELEGLQITEISGVSRGANLLDGYLALKKSARGVTRQEVWSYIQSRAEDVFPGWEMTIEQKISRLMLTDEGKRLWREWEAAPLVAPTERPGMTKAQDGPTLREASWTEIERRAVKITEARPAIPVHDAVETVLSSDEGKQLYGLYQHRYANKPLDEAKQAIAKSAAEDGTPFLRAIGLLGRS